MVRVEFRGKVEWTMTALMVMAVAAIISFLLSVIVLWAMGKKLRYGRLSLPWAVVTILLWGMVALMLSAVSFGARQVIPEPLWVAVMPGLLVSSWAVECCLIIFVQRASVRRAIVGWDAGEPDHGLEISGASTLGFDHVSA